MCRASKGGRFSHNRGQLEGLGTAGTQIEQHARPVSTWPLGRAKGLRFRPQCFTPQESGVSQRYLALKDRPGT